MIDFFLALSLNFADDPYEVLAGFLVVLVRWVTGESSPLVSFGAFPLWGLLRGLVHYLSRWKWV